MNTRIIIQIAEKHASNGSLMASSAQVALQDAKGLFERKIEWAARMRARTSLAYSVGVLHPDYMRVNAFMENNPIYK